MHPNAGLIERFYAAFGRRDHRVMAGCYSSTAHFSDPVFVNLNGPQIGLMWQMLCERATDLRIECGPVTATESTGRADWEAWYTYSATSRRVHNEIRATFTFHDGLIVRHADDFDLYRWSRQALGLKGLLLGWAPPVQRAIRAQACRALESFSRRNPLADGAIVTPPRR